MLYFAYGSNLDSTQMRQRCPSARFFGVARLDDHRHAFSRKSVTRGCGVADVVAAPGNSVWGVVYEIGEDDAAALDRHEGFRPDRSGNAYERVTKRVAVIGGQERLDVQTYVANPQPNPPPPSAEYLSLIIGAARFWQLPGDYITKLEQLKDGNER